MVSSTSMRAQLAAAAGYLEGDEIQYLQRVDSAGAALGDPIPFNPDFASRELEHTDAGSWVRESMLISVRSALVLNASYTWNGHTWTVQEHGSHHLGNSPGVWHYSLNRLVE